MPAIRVMSGRGRCRRRVMSSMRSIAPSAILPVAGSTSGPIRVDIELPSACRSHQRAILKITSSLVKASPFIHFPPARALRGQVRASRPLRPAKIPGYMPCCGPSRRKPGPRSCAIPRSTFPGGGSSTAPATSCAMRERPGLIDLPPPSGSSCCDGAAPRWLDGGRHSRSQSDWNRGRSPLSGSEVSART